MSLKKSQLPFEGIFKRSMGADLVRLADPDLLRWEYYPQDNRMTARFGTHYGHLIVRQFGVPYDTRLPHEIGHLLARPLERWWRYTNAWIGFDFREPTTRTGVMQLIASEIAATTIEEALWNYYYMGFKVGFVVQLHAFCEQNFHFLQPEGLDIKLIQAHYEEQKLTIDQVWQLWSNLFDKLRMHRDDNKEHQERMRRNEKQFEATHKFIQSAVKRGAYWG